MHPAGYTQVLALVTSMPDDLTACWTTSHVGRPKVSVGRKTVRAARIMLEAKLGRALGPGMFALHSCDNPACVNPRHLFEGTQRDNARDMASKGRGNTVKLTPERTAEVVQLVRQGWVQADIARAYRITPTRVCQLAKEHP